MTPFGDIRLGQHVGSGNLLVAGSYQSINWTNVDLSPIGHSTVGQKAAALENTHESSHYKLFESYLFKTKAAPRREQCGNIR